MWMVILVTTEALRPRPTGQACEWDPMLQRLPLTRSMLLHLRTLCRKLSKPSARWTSGSCEQPSRTKRPPAIPCRHIAITQHRHSRQTRVFINHYSASNVVNQHLSWSLSMLINWASSRSYRYANTINQDRRDQNHSMLHRAIKLMQTPMFHIKCQSRTTNLSLIPYSPFTSSPILYPRCRNANDGPRGMTQPAHRGLSALLVSALE
ncbi:hypothetical protein FOXYSP1_03500 [Fusarium oxysporum f. sp. phaseoli]